jgi:DNA-binding transcriptional ArsR family regulator
MAYENAAQESFAALADPTRRAIFERVATRPQSVSELAKGLPVSRPAVSQHLRVLREAGLVSERAEGTRRIYRLDPRGIGAMRDWLDAQWAAALDAFRSFADTYSSGVVAMSIAPIVRTVEVKAAPARAFDLFTTRMSDWWPRGKTLGKNPHATIVLEPRVGGAWLERDAEGNEVRWGKVLAWEPPSRLLLGWQLTSEFRYDPQFLTEVELTFAPAAGGGTLVTLEHRDLEHFGVDAAHHAEKLGKGWPQHLAEFATYADKLEYAGNSD